MKNQHAGCCRNRGARTRGVPASTPEIIAAVLALPPPADHSVGVQKSSLILGNYGANVVLVPVILPHDCVKILCFKRLPNRLIMPSIPPHDAAVDTSVCGTPQILEIAHSPEILQGLLPDPVYVADYHSVQVKIQQGSCMMFRVEQLHLVPPCSTSTGYMPGFKIMTYHVRWHRSVSFGVHMEPDVRSYVAT